MNKYLYSLLRFVPDTASGEFINIGAIVGSDEQAEWDIRQVSNQKRASSIDDAGVLDKVMERVSALQREVADAEVAFENGEDTPVSEGWLRQQHERHDRLLQFSEPSPIVADSAAAALDIVFRELITDPAVRRREFRTKHTAYSALLAAYKNAGLHGARTIQQRPTVTGANHAAKFDFAIANGKAVQLANAWSFETPKLGDLSTEVKAWGWAVQDLRRTGGSLRTLSGGTIEVPRAIDIEVLYLPPRDRAGEDALREALAVFSDANVKAHARPEKEVEAIAHEAATRLLQSRTGPLA